MNDRIRILANNALHGDIFPKSIRYDVQEEFNSESIGRGIKEYIKIQPVEFRQNEYLCDRYRFNGLNTPSDYYRVQYGERAKYWCTLCSNRPRDVFYWGWTHVAIDYEFILNNGFKGFYKKIDIARQNEQQKDNQQFYNGLKYCVDGICERYAKMGATAKKMALAESNLEQKKILDRLADTFTRIPLNPAKTFFDAVQLTWLSFLLAPDSLGRIDQYLYPFYKRDIASGLITKDFAFELLEELFIKVHESQADNVGLDISGHNHLVVGGYLQNGDDGFNELSKIILEAIVDLPTYRPQASFRYTNKTTAETMRFITEMNNKSQLTSMEETLTYGKENDALKEQHRKVMDFVDISIKLREENPNEFYKIKNKQKVNSNMGQFFNSVLSLFTPSITSQSNRLQEIEEELKIEQEKEQRKYIRSKYNTSYK